jgi:serine/threonine protein kinase/tetratricopeptide (TPR) repeat protein
MNERDLFIAVLQKEDPAERAALLDRACAGEPALRQRVEHLLRAYQGAGSFLEAPAPNSGVTVDEPPITEQPGEVVGPYKLMEQIGEGGFGLVFVAEQQHPVRRKVALKVIKPGMDTRDVIARFEAERQALALMDHPNIAKVLDAGATESGRPYFVMELVKGVPITEYCDQGQLTSRRRLELFVPVCQAVQHAHQKGVIHRDLKPSNILVTLHDGTPVVKVIDFGVAKAVGQHLTEKTIYTRFAQMIGTPLYMSPEQAEMSGLDIDTRSDVYSLGVLLYELLTGTTPFDRKRLHEAAFDEVRRIIREEEPPRPSARLTTLGETLPAVSAQRGTEPKKLSALVKGDLDWIVMKALEKDRARRYETASAFAADVRRFLGEEPVEARPPSATYRLRKLFRRNRVAVLTTAVVAAALVLGTAISTWQAIRATRAEAEARSAEDQATKDRDLARDAEQRADADKKNTQAALRFLLADVLEQADPFHEPDRDLKVRALLDRAASRLEGNKEMPPLVEAAIRLTMGRIYWGLGELEKAERQLTQAYALEQQHAGESHRDTLDAGLSLARLYWLQSDFSKAEPLFLRVVDGRRRLFGEEHPETLRALNGLGHLYLWRDEPNRAKPLFAQALQASRSRGDLDPDTLESMFGLGMTYHILGCHDDAEPLFDKAVKGYRAVRGDGSPETLVARSGLGLLYLNTGRLAEAERHLSETYRIRREVLSERNSHTLTSEANLARVYLAQGRRTEAEPLLREFLAKTTDQRDRLPPFTLATIGEVGRALLRQRDFAEAEVFLRLYLDLAAKKVPDSWGRYAAKASLGACLLGQQKYDEAAPLLLEGYAGLRRYEERIPVPFRRTRLTEALEPLVQLYGETGKRDEAAKWRKELEAAKATAKPNAGP